MIVRCGQCGRVYNDVACWTICPHGPLWGRPEAYCTRHDLVDCWCGGVAGDATKKRDA